MDKVYEESLKATFGQIKRSIENDDARNKLFNKTIKTLVSVGYSFFTSKPLSDREIRKVRDVENTMRTAEKFPDYIKAYKAFEHMIGMPHATIIYSIKYEKKAKNTVVKVKYSSQEKHITVPNKGTPLYHKSPAKFDELKPTFRGKQVGEGVSRGGYLYDSPRVYLSITDKMPRIAADLKANTKYHLYKIRENLNDLIVDPAFNSANIGAVYVKTDLPIKVDEVTKSDIEKEIAKEKAKVKKAAIGAAVAGVAVGAMAANKINKDRAKKEQVKETKERVEDFYNKGYITESEKDMYLYIIDDFTLEE